MNPRVKITDPAFRYSSSQDTDIRRLFKRVRKAQALQKKREQEKTAADTDKVLQIFRDRQAQDERR